MNKIFFLFFWGIYFTAFGFNVKSIAFYHEQEQPSATIFLNIFFEGGIVVYNNLEKDSCVILHNDIVNEDFIMFTIKDVNDSMFNVIAFSSLTDSVITSGWIYKNNHLGIFSSAYNKEQHMQLFEHPSTNSEIVLEESSYNSDVYEVIDADGEWLKVRICIRESIFEGWMPPSFQCSNPYTTCS